MVALHGPGSVEMERCDGQPRAPAYPVPFDTALPSFTDPRPIRIAPVRPPVFLSPSGTCDIKVSGCERNEVGTTPASIRFRLPYLAPLAGTAFGSLGLGPNSVPNVVPTAAQQRAVQN